MKGERKYNDYKSPLRKLIKFFESSRNKWKTKCREVKTMIKRLKNRIRFLERSKEHWKTRAKEVEKELVRLREKERELEEELERLKKKAVEERGNLEGSESLSVIPVYHKYSIGCIMLFVSLVLSAAASFRCVEHTIEIIVSFFGLPFSVPSWFTGRIWLLRLGYYKLTRKKEQAGDWVWIVDHTVQFGVEKCLVILGIRLSGLPPPGTPVSHEDVEPLALFPVKNSNGEIVYQQLEETIKETGIPREIIGDQGSDLKSGIEKFCKEHQKTCYIYDIKHKTANVLRNELQDDERWQEFTRLTAQTRQKVQQTSLSALAPPNQKTKARYMNIDILVQWGEKILIFLEKEETTVDKMFDQKQVKEKLGWVTQFRNDISEWKELFEIVAITESFVRKEGLYYNCHLRLDEILPLQVHTERAKKVREELLAFVSQESSKAKPSERLLGSSEVIESVFGKLKQLEQNQSKSGFTGMLLSVAAVVSKTTVDVVQKAMETVRTKQVLVWCKETLGKSLQSKRKEVFETYNKMEQKWDQLDVVV